MEEDTKQKTAGKSFKHKNQVDPIE